MPDVSPGHRFHKGVMIGVSLLLAVANALLSLVLVVLAVPGDGQIGAGFAVIAGMFVLGNSVLLGGGLFAARHHRPRVQIAGLIAQLLTIPLCIGLALLVLWVCGINDL